MRGYTLIELVLVLGLIAWATLVALPAGRAYRDRMAVVSAREAVAGLIAEARVTAISSGEAHVRLTADPLRAWIAVEGEAASRWFEPEPGVGVTLRPGSSLIELTFDALGLGRFASETIEFRRGAARARLIVSNYGRVRRD